MYHWIQITVNCVSCVGRGHGRGIGQQLQVRIYWTILSGTFSKCFHLATPTDQLTWPTYFWTRRMTAADQVTGAGSTPFAQQIDNSLAWQSWAWHLGYSWTCCYASKSISRTLGSPILWQWENIIMMFIATNVTGDMVPCPTSSANAVSVLLTIGLKST